jgi:hypothetical protein
MRKGQLQDVLALYQAQAGPPYLPSIAPGSVLDLMGKVEEARK